jgi:hypothetical protein
MISPNLVWILGSIAVAAVVVAIAAGLRRQSTPVCPYRRRSRLFSPAERSFLSVLEHAVAGNARVFGKVRVADVIEPISGIGASARQTAINRIDRKHFDFVLCAPDDLSVLAVVELDDASHEARNRQERDQFLSAACQAAGLPLIRIPAARTYSVSELRARLPIRSSVPQEVLS